VRALASCTPFDDGAALCRRYLVSHFWIAILGTKSKALEKLAACRLACCRRGKENAQPKVIRWVIARTEDTIAFRRSALHALAATRRGAHEHQAANKIGSRKGNFLRDKAADRKAQHIDFR